ncbi:MAG: extracellular solute-binding protein [Acetobacteraceae bacterium]
MNRCLTRRNVLAGAGLATGATGMWAAVRPTRAWAESNFTFSLVAGSYGRAEIRSFVTEPGFEKKNKIYVSYDYGASNVRAAKVMTSCHEPIVTVYDAYPQEADLFADGGCIRGYDLDIVTNYNDILDIVKEPSRNGISDFYAGYAVFGLGVTYNWKEIPRPRSFEDLLSPRLKGRVAVPAFSWIAPQFLYGVNAALGGTSGNVDKGFRFVADLVKKNDAIILPSTDSADHAFTTGQIVAMPFWNGRTNILAKDGVPVKVVYVKGWVSTSSGLCITRGTKFGRAANLLVNNSLSPDAQVSFMRSVGYPPSNKRAVLPPDMTDWGVPTDALGRVAKINWDIVARNMAANLERWNNEVLG